MVLAAAEPVLYRFHSSGRWFLGPTWRTRRGREHPLLRGPSLCPATSSAVGPQEPAPSCGTLYNTRSAAGEHTGVLRCPTGRVDVWAYIERGEAEIPSIYYAHERQVFDRDGLLLLAGQPVRDIRAITSADTVSTDVATDCTGGRRPDGGRGGSPSGGHPDHERARPADDRPARRRWKTASARGTSKWTTLLTPGDEPSSPPSPPDGHNAVLPPPARSTTASRR